MSWLIEVGGKSLNSNPYDSLYEIKKVLLFLFYYFSF